VTQAQGKTVAQKMGALYMECSSKEMSGVHEIFDTAINIAVRGQDEETHGDSGARSGGSRGDGGQMPLKKKKRSGCKIL